MTSAPAVAVVGAGAGGLAMAADLTASGFRVHLYELPEFAAALDPIRRRGGIDLRGVRDPGVRRPAVVTDDAREALEGVELIHVVVPAFGHQRVMELIGPHLRAGQFVLFNTGYWAALRFHRKVAAHDPGITLAESTLLVYAARLIGPGAVLVDGIKNDLPVAAFPATRTDRLIELLRPAYPQVRAMRNVLEVSLENLNPLFHPAISLLNAGELGRVSGDFAFYRTGCTPAVGRVIDAVDRERRAVGRAFGFDDLLGAPEWLHRYYGATGTSAHEAISSCPAYREFRWPASTAIRYVHEDVPFAFVPLVRMAERFGIAVPIIRALIDLCGVAFERDYWRLGPDAEALGLRDVTAEDVRLLSETGSAAVLRA